MRRKEDTMTEQQVRTIERMGLNPDDNSELIEGFESGEAAVEWFLSAGWPADWDGPTEDDREALEAYVRN
jgi:hypothetical protein